jgi:hypothetical protein
MPIHIVYHDWAAFFASSARRPPGLRKAPSSLGGGVVLRFAVAIARALPALKSGVYGGNVDEAE